MSAADWLMIGLFSLLALVVLLANPWTLNWWFNRQWNKVQSESWRKRFLKDIR